MVKAFAYLRVSGLSQVEGDGFPRQIEAINDYCSKNDIELVKVYRDEGVSGKNDLDDRPALQEMIVDLLSNGVRTVLIEKLDRLARKLIVQETILQDLTRKGFTLISVSEPDACSDDPTRTLIRQILGAFFEYERKMIVSKLRAARQRKKAKDGRCEGKKPFGTRPGEELVWATILSYSLHGLDPKQIAAKLNADGCKTRHNKRWHSATIWKMLDRHESEKKTTPTAA